MSYHYVLKAARKRCGYTLREAAAAVHVAPSTIYRYEEALILKIPVDTLEALFALYGIARSDGAAEKFRTEQQLRLELYQESRQPVTADFLYASYLKMDARGRHTMLHMLLEETGRYPEETPRPDAGS